MERTNEEKLAWLARRIGFGVLELPVQTIGSLLDRLIADATAEDAPSPWAMIEVPTELDGETVRVAATAWLEHMASSSAVLRTWMTWFWHDHFAVSAPVVKSLRRFTTHIELLQEHALGSFDLMLREVTIDPAMLIFLNGRQNSVGAVNENYGRELLELYALGIDNYDEADVRAAAEALTGWTFRQVDEAASFVPFRHESTPGVLLGQPVSDLDSVIRVITEDSSCAAHIVEKLSTAILGAPLSVDLAEPMTERFRSSGLDSAVLVRELLALGVEGEGMPIVLAPVPWLLQVEAMTSSQLSEEERLYLLRQMGQIPGVPPNVGGYPDQATWAGPSTTIGRFRAASLVAARTPDGAPILDAARGRRWADVASLAARPEGFSNQTVSALDSANVRRRDGREALAAALMSPELAVA